MTYKFYDHKYRAEQLLLEQDRQPRIKAMLQVVTGRIQVMEDVLWDILQHTWLDSATGADLDRLGAIVGEGRLGRDDTTYRLWIRARGRANRSAGRVDDILEILRLVLGPDALIHYTDVADRNAEAYFVITGADADLAQVAAIIAAVAPAGVRTQIIASTYPPTETFSFAGGPGKGFNEGHFSSVILP